MRLLKLCPGRALAAVVLLCAGAGIAAAQAVPSVEPRYVPGSRLLYALSIHSEVAQTGTIESAQLDTEAEVAMTILPGPAAGPYQAEMKFTRYVTTVKASPTMLEAMKQLSIEGDKAALAMPPARFQVGRDVQLLARAPGDDYDQPLTVLQQIIYSDVLPKGPPHSGDKWSLQRNQTIPALHFAPPTTVDVETAAVGPDTLTLKVHSYASAAMPPEQVPNHEALIQQGVVPTAKINFDTNATSVYRVADGILQSSESQSKNQLHMVLTGLQTQTMDTNITNNGTLKLESVTPPPAP